MTVMTNIVLKSKYKHQLPLCMQNLNKSLNSHVSYNHNQNNQRTHFQLLSVMKWPECRGKPIKSIVTESEYQRNM